MGNQPAYVGLSGRRALGGLIWAVPHSRSAVRMRRRFENHMTRRKVTNFHQEGHSVDDQLVLGDRKIVSENLEELPFGLDDISRGKNSRRDCPCLGAEYVVVRVLWGCERNKGPKLVE